MNKNLLIFKFVNHRFKSFKVHYPSFLVFNEIHCKQFNYYAKSNENSKANINYYLFGVLTTFVGFVGFLKHKFDRNIIFADSKKNEHEDIISSAGQLRPDLPNFKYEEISEHATVETRIWVTYRDGVYDITDFILKHPGGSEKIMMACGGSVEPFWQLYGVHKTEHVLAMLEDMRIGNVHPDEEKVVLDSTDPFSSEPKRHPSLKINVPTPFNAETPTQILVDNFMTPNQLFFVRNHLPVPHTDDKRLKIEGLGIKKEIVLSVEELVRKFKPVTITSSVMCAGNRRKLVLLF